LFSSKISITVHLNMSERENGQLPLAKRTIRSRISSERWEQIKVAYVSGIGLREIARKMNIPEGTVLAHAKRHGWTQQIQVATQQQSDAITPVQSVPESLAAILGERKERTRLGLSKYTAEAAEEAADLPNGKLNVAGKVRDVAAIHSTLWPEEKSQEIFSLGILIGREEPKPVEGKIIDASASDCSATDVTPEGTPAPMRQKGPGAQPTEAVNPPWEEPRDRAVIFKCRRG
jgi:hypothetical protein